MAEEKPAKEPPQPQQGSYGYAHRMEYVSDFWREKYARETGKYWDKFYRSKKKGYLASTKERSYLEEDLAEELKHARKLLEIGCGVGHSIIPLARVFKELTFFALDISTRAIEIIKSSAEIPQERCVASVCDIEKDELSSCGIKDNEINCVLLIFVLSSCTPSTHKNIITKLAKTLVSGGTFYFRDYAKGDECQLDFDEIFPPRKISENFYVRSDATRAYFFTLEEIETMLCDCGLIRDELTIIRIEKHDTGRPRLFVKAKFHAP